MSALTVPELDSSPAAPPQRSGLLRIGMVSSFMPPHLGGLELAAENIFEAYRAAGHTVRWVASRVPETLAERDGDRIRVNTWNFLERRCAVPWPVWGPSAMREVERLVEWSDVVHIHDCLYFGSAVAAAACRRQGKAYLLSQQIGFVAYPFFLWNAIERAAYQTLGRSVMRGAAHIACCSPESEAHTATLLGRGAPPVTRIFNGIDLSKFRPPTDIERVEARRRFGIPADARVALLAGRLVHKKGISLFLELCRENPDHHFLLVGDGPLRPEARPNLTWIPNVPAPRMNQIYHAADVYVLASHSEAFPLVMKEAMASALPVVASKGQPYTEGLGQAGACLVKDRAPADFSEALRRLRSEPDLGPALTRRANELLAPDWDLEQTTARFLNLIDEVAAASCRKA